MMKVTVTYEDNTSLTAEEVKEANKRMHGSNSNVKVEPVCNTAESYIYFGIQQAISEDQFQLFYDDGQYVYQTKIKTLRANILKEIERILNEVIIDNENKVS